LASTPLSKIVSQSTSVVQFGVTGASNNIRLNKYSRDITVFNNDIISQLVGHLLGDGSIHYSRTSVTPYFVFTQTIKRFKYIWHVYKKLSPYCARVPLINPGLRKGKPHPFIQVMTRSYPALIVLHKLFYQISVIGNNSFAVNGNNSFAVNGNNSFAVNGNNSFATKKKVITTSLLQYLNPVVIAY
jgi:hypothetical protein